MSLPATSPRTGSRIRRSRVVLAGLGLLGCLSMAALVSPGGPHAASVLAPRWGEVVGISGVEVMVQLPMDGRVDPDGLRVLLNGADVTDDLLTGRNGAHGRLHGLLDGENVLRFEVTGPSYWMDDRRFENAREVRFMVRRPLDTNRG